MMTPGSLTSGKSAVVQTQYSQMEFSAVSFELLDCGFPPPTNKHMLYKGEFLPTLQHKQSTRMEEVTFPQQKQYLNVCIASKAGNVYETQ